LRAACDGSLENLSATRIIDEEWSYIIVSAPIYMFTIMNLISLPNQSCFCWLLPLLFNSHHQLLKCYVLSLSLGSTGEKWCSLVMLGEIPFKYINSWDVIFIFTVALIISEIKFASKSQISLRKVNQVEEHLSIGLTLLNYAWPLLFSEKCDEVWVELIKNRKVED
jgi:hypothetical protein